MQIPDNFFPGTERPGSNTSKSSKSTPANSTPDPSVTKSTDPVSRAVTLNALTQLFPDVATNILNLYSRAWTFTDDKLPPLAFSQSAIRYAKLLSSVYLAHGVLDDMLLRHLVLNAELSPQEEHFEGSTHTHAKGDIIELLMRGYPGPPPESSMTIADHTTVLAGIASVLSELGYQRKKAFVLKELMVNLLPALVQARKAGAAEMGVHPAASLASLNASASTVPIEMIDNASDDSEQGMRHLLSLVSQSYGIVPVVPAGDPNFKDLTTPHSSESQDDRKLTGSQRMEAIASQGARQAFAKALGSQDLKVNVLRSCINICEALPDLGGVLHYSATLLRIAGSGIAPGPDSSDGSPDLALDEQVRLVNNISRTLSAAKQLRLDHPEADYWDDFMVRGIEPLDTNRSRPLRPHAKAELELVSTIESKKERNPFIYNPFLKNKTSTAKTTILVANEEAYFRVTLQNLYDVDVLVERVKLIAEGVPFEGEIQSTIIGPYRTQTIVLSGTPLASGTLTIYGCLAKVKGCRERIFPTLTEPWSLKPEINGKPMHFDVETRPGSTVPISNGKKTRRMHQSPVPTKLAVQVLRAQPNIKLKSIAAPQGAIMLLEGEVKSFTIILHNLSTGIPADLLLLSFDDSIAIDRQSAMLDKGLSAAGLYELEIAAADVQPLSLHPRDRNLDLNLQAGEEINLRLNILGKRGLSYAAVQVDYGHLGVPKADVEETFYTWQLTIPLTTSVNASLELVRSDVVALTDPLPLAHKSSPSDEGTSKPIPAPSSTHDTQNLSNRDQISPSSPPHCLLLLDFRNSWRSTLTLTLEISDPSSSTSTPKTHTQNIQPGTTQRIPLPLPRHDITPPPPPQPPQNPPHKTPKR